MTLEVVSLRQLFSGFTLIGVSGFGGVLPWARRHIVERRGWVDAAEFNELLGLCQILPGPNVVNLAVLLGARFQGWRGALVAPLGILLPPMLIVLCLGLLWQQAGAWPLVAGALRGVAAVGAGLILATGLKMLAAYRRDALGVALAALVFIAIGALRWPLLPVMAALAPVGWLLAMRRPP